MSDLLHTYSSFTKDGLARKSEPQEAELDHPRVFGLLHSSAHNALRVWR